MRVGKPDSLGNIPGNPFLQAGRVQRYESARKMPVQLQNSKSISLRCRNEQQGRILRGETTKNRWWKYLYGSIVVLYYCQTGLKPHWHISSRKIKSIEGTSSSLRPFNFYFNGIPDPFGLPFGIIPNTNLRRKLQNYFSKLWTKSKNEGLFLTGIFGILLFAIQWFRPIPVLTGRHFLFLMEAGS